MLIPYSENGLDALAQERMEHHLAVCERCRADLAAIRSVAGALTNAPDPALEPAADLWARVSERIAAETPRQSRHSWLRAPQAISAAAAAVLVIAVGVTIMRSGLLTENVTPPPTSMDRAALGRVHEDGKKANAPLVGTKRLMTAKRPALRTAEGEPVGPKTSPDLPPTIIGNRVAAAPSQPEMRRNLHGSFGAVDKVSERAVPKPPPAAPDYYSYAAAPAAPECPKCDADTVGLALSARPIEAKAEVAACATSTAGTSGESVVDALNETEGVRTAALFTYP